MNFKNQKVLGVLYFVVLFFLFSTFVATEGKKNRELEKLKAIKDAHPNTAKDYRGVVALDANGGGSDELYCDFGSDGLWVYEKYPAGGWIKLNAANPEWIIGFEEGGAEYLLCDFGAAGLWYWQYGASLPGSFVKVSSADPDGNAFVSDCDDDGDDEIFLTFGANGLWVYDKGAATILTKLHATSPDMYDSLRMDCWAVGYEEGALDFDTQGMWSHYGPGIWKKLNASSSYDDNSSANVEGTAADEELIIDFAGNGLWLYDGGTWHMLSANEAFDMVPVLFGTTDYELLVQFDPAVSTGLWMWNYSGYPGTWTLLSSTETDWDDGFCEPFDPDEDGRDEAAVDFAANGLWVYDHDGASWTKINTGDASFMVAAEIEKSNYKTDLIVDFGASGLWHYRGDTSTWTQLTTASPDG
jgi:hypothetical protein